MQPDPDIFLAAIRRQLLSDDMLGAGVGSGHSANVLARIAEALAYFAVRRGALPQVLRNVRPSLVALLHSMKEQLSDGAETAAIAVALARACEVDPQRPSDVDIGVHDELTDALASGVRALAAGAGGDVRRLATVAEVSAKAARIEIDYRRELGAALDAWRRDADHSPEQETLPPLTSQVIAEKLRKKFPDMCGLDVEEFHRGAGGSSKDLYFIKIRGLPGWSGDTVLRREPKFNPTRGSLMREAKLLQHLHAKGALVPRVLLAEGDENAPSGGFVLMEQLPGMPKTTATIGDKARAILIDVARRAAHFHHVEYPSRLQGFCDRHDSPQARMLAMVDDYYRRWRTEQSRESLAIEVGYRWLQSNVQRITPATCIVHGDFNLRNILLDKNHVTGLLDWELAHLGDPAEDLAYIRPDVEAVMDWATFLAAYNAVAAQQVEEQAIGYFEVWSYFWRSVISSINFEGFVHGRHANFAHASVAYIENRRNEDGLFRCIASGAAATGSVRLEPESSQIAEEVSRHGTR